MYQVAGGLVPLTIPHLLGHFLQFINTLKYRTAAVSTLAILEHAIYSARATILLSHSVACFALDIV